MLGHSGHGWARVGRAKCSRGRGRALVPYYAYPLEEEEEGVKEREGGKGRKLLSRLSWPLGWAGWARGENIGRSYNVRSHDAE